MKIQLEIMGPVKKLIANNPETLEIAEGSKIVDMMEQLGYTKTEAKFLIYMRNDDRLTLNSLLKENDYITAVLQLGGG